MVERSRRKIKESVESWREMVNGRKVVSVGEQTECGRSKDPVQILVSPCVWRAGGTCRWSKDLRNLQQPKNASTRYKLLYAILYFLILELLLFYHRVLSIMPSGRRKCGVARKRVSKL